MIERMQKILLMGPVSLRKEMVRQLQNIGVIHVEPYTGELFEKEGREVDASKLDRIETAYRSLKRYEPKGEKEKDLCPIKLVDRLFDLEKRLEDTKEVIKILNHKMESIEPWGSFDLSLLKDIEKRGKVAIQFWDVSLKVLDRLEGITIENHIAAVEIFTDTERKYFITISKKPIRIDDCLEVKFDMDMKTVKSRLKEALEKREEIESGLAELSLYREEINSYYLRELNKINVQKAISGSVETLDNSIFALQGWCPVDEINALKSGLESQMVHVTEIAPDEDEKIPTLIKNKGYAALGQDLVEIYDTPGYRDWDPSSWLFFCFTIFFAMIMADGGYGLVLLLILFYFKKKVKNPSEGLKRFFNMSMVLSGATLVYGVISGSVFGLSLDNPGFAFMKPITSALGALRLFDGTDKDMMMKTAIIIGMFHINLSLVLKAFRSLKDDRNPLGAVNHLIWIFNIWVFYFWYTLKEGNPAQAQTMLYMLYGGLGGVFVTSAGSLNPLKFFVGGFGGVYNGVQFFSDILSYIRIFALALSGALIAQTFNNMAFDVWNAGIVGKLFAPLVFVLGHVLNIMLCIMGGVIHGLRLNFLEWYRWCFDGNGKKFRPLRDLLSENGK